jgi:diguanylate cyclase (GGDEF)-like protein
MSQPYDAIGLDYEADTITTIEHEQRTLLQTIFDYFPGGIAVYDSNLRLTFCNTKLKHMLEYPEELFSFGMPSMEQLFRFNASRGEYGEGGVEHHVASRLHLVQKREAHVYERTRPNGQVLEVRGMPIEDGGFLTIYIDISLQRRQANDSAQQQNADIDKLTHLPTQRPLERQLDILLRGMQHGEVACLHCIDLDQFTKVNQTYGNTVGDFVLKEVALRLAKVTRGTDFLARTGGDSFQILQTRILRPSDVTRLASRMIDSIRSPIRCGDINISLRATIGFSTINDHTGQCVQSIINRASESVMMIKQKTREIALVRHEAASAVQHAMSMTG